MEVKAPGYQVWNKLKRIRPIKLVRLFSLTGPSRVVPTGISKYIFNNGFVEIQQIYIWLYIYVYIIIYVFNCLYTYIYIYSNLGTLCDHWTLLSLLHNELPMVSQRIPQEILGHSCAGPAPLVKPRGFRERRVDGDELQGGAPQTWCWLVYKPHEYYKYNTNKNHSEIGVMFVHQLSYRLGAPPWINN